jgi:ABC-2 type transport system permease protein
MILGSVFTKTLHENRKSLFWWTLGTVAFIAFALAFYPSIKNQPSLNQVFEGSTAVKAFIGTSDVTSPNGFLIREVFSIMGPLFLIIYGISLGTAAIAGEEGKKTLALLLANPVSRSRVVIDKFAAMTASLGIVSVASFLAIIVSAPLFQLNVDELRVAEAVFSMFLLGLSFGSIGFLVGAATGNRSMAGGITGALAFAMYLFDIFRQIVSSLDPYRWLSLFYYYGTERLLTTPPDVGRWAVLAAIPLVCLVLSAASFSRRDIGT